MKPADLEIMKNIMVSIPQEMGVRLRRGSMSPNIKERMDASCAVFDADGSMVSQAEHIPVHLGSMPRTLEAVRKLPDVREGRQYCLNDPYSGGTHLPDITVVKPVFFEDEIVGYVANRAHHSDVGGSWPGSMPGEASEVFEEGLLIPPVELTEDVMRIIMSNSRRPHERYGDIRSQMAANDLGERLLKEFIGRCSLETYSQFLSEFYSYCRLRMKRSLERLPHGSWLGSARMECGAEIHVRLSIDEQVHADFSGTSEQYPIPVNAPLAVTEACVFFFLRCITAADIPLNPGVFQDVRVSVPAGTILNPVWPAAVSGGNVETSQKVVDALLDAYSGADRNVPAHSQGTMNNVAMGSRDFAYYETIGGGAGALPDRDGEHGVHTYMTNTMNTPVEAVELYYPLTVLECSLIPGSGGEGRFSGGMGIRKAMRVECESAVLSVQSENRSTGPGGRNGGMPGRPGRNMLIRDGKKEVLKPWCTVRLKKGDVVVIETPGGGGWGAPE